MYYSVTASTDLSGKGKTLRAYSVAETAGAAATVNLRDGGVSGPIVIALRFAAITGGSDRTQSFSHPLLAFPAGVYVQVASGAVQCMVDLV